MKRMRLPLLFMQLLLCTTVALFFHSRTSAQAPLQFNYQAVARDNRGVPMAGKDIRIRFTILNESINGEAEYMEIRKIQTNLFGMFSVSIGSEGATFSTGSLKNVKWETGKKFLKAEIDPSGSNRYIDLGATQLVSVPYALFALKTLESPGMDGGSFSGAAGNGLSITDSTVMLGNEEGSNKAQLLNNRIIPLNNKSISFVNGVSKLTISKENLEIQQDSAVFEGDENYSQGIFLKVNPIFHREDALPFLFTRRATPQHGGGSSPNEVVMWGFNLNQGGGSYIAGLPAIGYSIESNFKPSPDDRLVESHEFYVTPQGNQIRLKSYTIDTKTNFIDFYHSSNNFYIKNPKIGNDYFHVSTNDDNSSQSMGIGGLSFHSNNDLRQYQITPDQSNSSLYFSGNWQFLYLPGLTISTFDSLVYTNFNIFPELDSKNYIGSYTTRFDRIFNKVYFGSQTILKQDWQVNEGLVPTATLDIEGIQGFNQFRLRKTYTPSNSADVNGNTGDMAWDENYIYIKTAGGWKRTRLENF